jgi:hypothetical protein
MDFLGSRLGDHGETPAPNPALADLPSGGCRQNFYRTALHLTADPPSV